MVFLKHLFTYSYVLMHLNAEECSKVQKRAYVTGKISKIKAWVKVGIRLG